MGAISRRQAGTRPLCAQCSHQCIQDTLHNAHELHKMKHLTKRLQPFPGWLWVKIPFFFPLLFSESSSTLWQIQCQTALAHRLWPAPSPAQQSSKFRERSSWNIQTQRHPHANTHCSVHSSPQAELVEPGFLLLSNIQQPHKGRTDCSLLLQQCYPRFYSFVIRFVGT